jgi:RNA polymerase sigma-70 factor
MPAEQPQSEQYREFLACFTEGRDRLFAYIFSLLPRHSDAEDVFQRCSILLWRKFDQFDRSLPFHAWACGVAFYEVRNFLRVSGRERLYFDVELINQIAELRSTSDEQSQERLVALQSCMQNLSPSERQLVQHVYAGQGSLKDLAEAWGKAPQTLYNQLNLIRRKLFECVQHRLTMVGVSR